MLMHLKRTLWMGAVAVAGGLANFALGLGAHALGLPLYFDSIFTIAVTAAFGPIAGVVTALVSNAALSATNDVLLPFMLCNLATVLCAWLVKRRNGLRSLEDYLWVGLWSGISNGLLGSLISAFAFGGVTKVHKIDNLVSGFLIAGQSLLSSVFLAGLVTNLVDKLLSAIAAFALLGLARRREDQSAKPSRLA
jgi:energy-coupling factor transport system substrate-specific component